MIDPKLFLIGIGMLIGIIFMCISPEVVGILSIAFFISTAILTIVVYVAHFDPEPHYSSKYRKSERFFWDMVFWFSLSWLYFFIVITFMLFHGLFIIWSIGMGLLSILILLVVYIAYYKYDKSEDKEHYVASILRSLKIFSGLEEIEKQ